MASSPNIPTPKLTEAEFLAAYDPSAYPSVAVTGDAVLFTIKDGQLSILLIQRADHPFIDHWALPGGFSNPDEDISETVRRELMEETGLTLSEFHLEQLATYSAPKRDPRMRTVSVAYIAMMPYAAISNPVAGSDASLTRFWPVSDLFSEDGPALAFDHAQIIKDGLERVRAKLEYSTLALYFVDDVFTMPELRRVYEAVWDVTFAPGSEQSNFARKVLATDNFVVPTEEETAGTRGRPARLYRKGTAQELIPPLTRKEA